MRFPSDKPSNWLTGLALWAGFAVGAIVAIALGPGEARPAGSFIFVVRILAFALLGGAIGAVCGVIVQAIKLRRRK